MRVQIVIVPSVLRFLLLSFFALLAVAPLPAASAVAATRPAIVSIAPVGDGVRVTFELPAPVTELRLRIADAQVPTGVVRAEEGFTYRRGRISAAAPFRRVSLHVTPDNREVDSAYPALRALRGGGLVIHAPYFLPATGAASLRVAGSDGRLRRLSGVEADGYVLLGAAPSRFPGHRAFVANGTPAPVSEIVLARTSRLLAFYRARLGRRPLREPLIIVATFPSPEGSQPGLFRGDVTPNGVVFLRLYGDEAQLGGAASTSRLTGFLAHELFHLWNRSRDPHAANWWLAEGGAEYASWLATSILWPGQPTLESRLDSTLATCTTYLGPRALGGLDDLDGRSVRYPCGAIVQWIADAGARANGGDFFTLWSRLLARAARRGTYTPEDFQASISASAPAAALPVRALVNGTGNDRWADIARGLTGMGSLIEIGAPSPFALRLAAARALVLSACGEVYGVGDGPHGLFVQAPEECALFGNSPVIERAAGAAPMQEPQSFYERVRAGCGAGTEIALALRSGGAEHSTRLRCTIAVVTPPPALRVVRALPGNGLRRH